MELWRGMTNFSKGDEINDEEMTQKDDINLRREHLYSNTM
jgi:hypothetical protein